MPKEWTARAMGRKGGKRRAERFGKRQISAWGKQGGRPAKLDGAALASLRQLLATGKSQAECAKAFGVSLRTIGRLVARFKAEGRQAGE